MPDPTREPDNGDDLDVERERTGLPRWVWLAGIIAVLVVLLVVIVLFVGVGHTPGPPPGGH